MVKKTSNPNQPLKAMMKYTIATPMSTNVGTILNKR